MRNIKNIGMCGRSVLCTIHQPSREIFSCFDALLLLKRGGSTLFFGELGENARNLTTYLARASGIPFSKAENPATYMLDATKEDAAGSVDFAAVWAESDLAKQCDAMIESMLGAGEPDEGRRRELTVEHAFAASELQQITTLSWKYTVSYWRKPAYNAVRLTITTFLGLCFGAIYWRQGEIGSAPDQGNIQNIGGALFASILFIGAPPRSPRAFAPPDVDERRHQPYHASAAAPPQHQQARCS